MLHIKTIIILNLELKYLAKVRSSKQTEVKIVLYKQQNQSERCLFVKDHFQISFQRETSIN